MLKIVLENFIHALLLLLGLFLKISRWVPLTLTRLEPYVQKAWLTMVFLVSLARLVNQALPGS